MCFALAAGKRFAKSISFEVLTQLPRRAAKRSSVNGKAGMRDEAISL